jgi:hypothetical protein
VQAPVVLHELSERHRVLKAHEAAELLAADALTPERITIAAPIKRALAVLTAFAPAVDPLAVALLPIGHGLCAPLDVTQPIDATRRRLVSR